MDKVRRYYESIFKRNISQVSFDDLFELPLKVLSFAGFTLATDETFLSDGGNRRGEHLFWMNNFMLTIMIALNAVDSFTAPHELKKVAFGVTLILSYSIFILRSLTLSFRKRQFCKLLLHLRDLYPKKDSPQVLEQFKSFTAFKTCYSINICIAALFVITAPVFQVLVNGNRNFVFPLSNYIFDLTSNAIYPIILVCTIMVTIHSAAIVISVDMLFYGLITTVALEFLDITDMLQSIKNLNDTAIDAIFDGFIEKHCNAYDLGGKLEENFSFLFLHRFTVSASIIGFMLFQLSASTNAFDTCFLVGYIISELTQIFMQCYFGQLLIDASVGVAEAIYCCEWEKWKDSKLKKRVLIVLMKSQRSMHITIGKFGIISMEQFAKVRVMISLCRYLN
jgi:7tm Odorant receptor